MPLVKIPAGRSWVDYRLSWLTTYALDLALTLTELSGPWYGIGVSAFPVSPGFRTPSLLRVLQHLQTGDLQRVVALLPRIFRSGDAILRR